VSDDGRTGRYAIRPPRSIPLRLFQTSCQSLCRTPLFSFMNRAVMTRCSTSRATMAARSCRPVRAAHKTRPRLNRRCRSLSVGSWRACVTNSSTACTKSIRLWRRCSRTSLVAPAITRAPRAQRPQAGAAAEQRAPQVTGRPRSRTSTHAPVAAPTGAR
jgi:hypothetical protein